VKLSVWFVSKLGSSVFRDLIREQKAQVLTDGVAATRKWITLSKVAFDQNSRWRCHITALI